jgi:hypothetical protein
MGLCDTSQKCNGRFWLNFIVPSNRNFRWPVQSPWHAHLLMGGAMKTVCSERRQVVKQVIVNLQSVQITAQPNTLLAHDATIHTSPTPTVALA